MNLGINGRFWAARVTGVQRFAREVSARLLERENVTLFLPGNVTIAPDRSQRAVTVAGTLRGRAWEQLELPLRLRAASCDVCVHLAQSAPRFGHRSIVMVHDLTPLTNPAWYTPGFRLWFRTALVAPARRARRVLVPSEWMRGEAARILGVERGRIDVVSQGVSPFNCPADPAAVAAVRARHHLPGAYLLATGGGDRRKNLGFLLDVLRRWPSGRGTAPLLVIIGSGYPQVHAAGPRLDARDVAVRVLGYVEDPELRALYTGAAAFCYPSLAEGFGRPPLEAMACGTPAVVTDYGPTREVLGEAATILPLDPQTWAGELAGLVADPAARQAWVERGLRQARKYRWEAAVETVLAACRVPHEGNNRGVRDRLKTAPAIYPIWHAAKTSKPVRAFRRWHESRVDARTHERHARLALHAQPAYAAEATHLAALLHRLHLQDGFVVDIAAGDGVTQSSTLFLFRDPCWRGLAVEADTSRFGLLEFAYRQFPNARLSCAKVTPTNVADLLRAHDVPADFTVLNLDIDSYDLDVAEAILAAYRPIVIDMEINEKVPPPVYFAVRYDPEHVWAEDHFYGCSLTAAAKLLSPRGYVLEGLEYNNAFFVRRDVALGQVRDIAVDEAYRCGYVERADRKVLFPWNRNVEGLLQLSPERVVQELRRRFQRYEGRYRLEVTS